MRKVIKIIDFKYLSLALWVFMTMMYILAMGVSNNNVVAGQKLDTLLKLEAQLKMDNQILENQIASASALRTISVKAKEMGFGEAKVMYIK